jgi:hypothetical protein
MKFLFLPAAVAVVVAVVSLSTPTLAAPEDNVNTFIGGESGFCRRCQCLSALVDIFHDCLYHVRYLSHLALLVGSSN